jgi:hypothetical protein
LRLAKLPHTIKTANKEVRGVDFKLEGDFHVVIAFNLKIILMLIKHLEAEQDLLKNLVKALWYKSKKIPRKSLPVTLWSSKKMVKQRMLRLKISGLKFSE